MGVTIDDDFTGGEKKDKKPAGPSASTLLIKLAQERYQFGCTEEGAPYAVKPGGHVVRMLRGGKNSLRAELSQTYYRLHGKAAPQQGLADALLALEGEALSGDPSRVHLRVAARGGIVWLDLGDSAETVIRIDAEGWRIVTSDVPVLFQRTALTGALPIPRRGGDLDTLWEQLNVTKEDRPLVLGWLVAAIATPDAPHPILSLFGEQGTAKSTTTRRIVELIDPSPVPLRKPPRDAESWVTAAQGSWVVGVANRRGVPDWLSDSRCRAATGDGDVRRQLYTDGGLAVFAFRRCVLLNGIDVGALRGDLADRIVRVSLERISEDARQEETQLSERWRQDHPYVLGAVLAVVAELIQALPFVRLEKSPRMADFAHVLATLDALYDTEGLARFNEQAKAMAADSLSADPLIAAMTAARLEFAGTAAELLEELKPADDKRPPHGWPKHARAVTQLLRRHAPALRKSGWDMEEATEPHTKLTEWRLTHPERFPKATPHTPHNPQGNGSEAPSADYAVYAEKGSGVSRDTSTCQVVTWRVCKNRNCHTFGGCVLKSGEAA
jgi:hypothetical protein